MVTLVKPAAEGLWPLIWANVPRGEPLGPKDLNALPWMRATETPKPVTVPESDSPSMPDPEVFFGQPRRLRLVAQDDAVTLVIQKPWGTNYSGWRHPLTPYYRTATEFLPRPSQAGELWLPQLAGSDPSERERPASRNTRTLPARHRRSTLQLDRCGLGNG